MPNEPKRPAWYVEQDVTACPYQFFLSHAKDDKGDVLALKKTIESKSQRTDGSCLRCFVDVDDWPLGVDATLALRRRVLDSEFMVLWVTSAYVTNPRGWIWMELAYAELIELSRKWDRPNDAPSVVVPVFRGVKVDELERTPLLNYWQRKFDLQENAAIDEIAELLIKFYGQQVVSP